MSKPKYHYNHFELQTSQPGEYQFHKLMHDHDMRLCDFEIFEVYNGVHLHKIGTKKKGEIDFLILTEYGIFVIEVKRGVKVKYENNRYYRFDLYRQKWEELKKNPYTQVDNATGEIVKKLKKNKLLQFYVHSVISFPEAYFEGKTTHDMIDLKMVRDNEYNMFDILKKFIIDGKGSNNRYKGKLDLDDIERIKKVLLPANESNENIQLFSRNELQNDLNEESIKNVLAGLYENKRLLIQTPIGGSKSVFVKEHIESYLKDRFDKVLYLCWNDFLAASMKLRLEGCTNVDVFNFLDFVRVLSGKNNLPKETDPYAYLYDNFSLLSEKYLELKDKGGYDFIVLDEAQDLFSRGLFWMLNILGEGEIENLKYAIYFDSLSSPKIENAFPSDDFDPIKAISSFYKMPEDFRLSKSTSIDSFLNDLILKKHESISSIPMYNSVSIVKCNDVIRAVKKIKENTSIYSEIETDELRKSVLLYTSRVGDISAIVGKEKYIYPITSENLLESKDKIGYTTSLKFTGITSPIVHLICTDFEIQKDLSQWYQVVIGASRATSQLYIYVV